MGPASVPAIGAASSWCCAPVPPAARSPRRAHLTAWLYVCVCVCVSQLADYHAFQDLAVCGAQPCCACSAELCREGLGLQRAPLACRTAPCPCTR